jgi:hypothetical protein
MEVVMSKRALKHWAFFCLLAVVGVLCWHMLRLPQEAAAKLKDTSQQMFRGGSGDTPATAVIIVGAPDYVAVVQAEYQFLKKQFGKQDRDWQVAEKEEYQHDDKVYDLYTIEFPNDTRQMVFFDITKYFEKKH